MKIYMAGVGAATDILRARNVFKDARIFISYFDMTDTAMRMIFKHGPKEIICDSGAHAYFARTETSSATPHHKAKGELPPVEEYLENYLRFCRRFKNQVDYFVELDTQEIHGREFQKLQRSKIEEAVGKEKIIPVFHHNESDEAFNFLIDNYKFIGIEGCGTKQIAISKYLKLVKFAYDRGVKIHAFASIKDKFLKQVPVYSTDASSWSCFYRYGKFIHFEKDKLKFFDKGHSQSKYVRKHCRGVVRVVCNKRYFDGKAGRQVMKSTVENIQKYESFLTKLWKERGVRWESSAK